MLLFVGDGTYHVEDVVGDTVGTDCFHVLIGDHILVHAKADQLFQFHLYVLHVGSGFGEQQLNGIFRNFFAFPVQDTADPAFQGIFILHGEFCGIALRLNGFVQFTAFVHFAFCEDKKSGVIGGC